MICSSISSYASLSLKLTSPSCMEWTQTTKATDSNSPLRWKRRWSHLSLKCSITWRRSLPTKTCTSHKSSSSPCLSFTAISPLCTSNKRILHRLVIRTASIAEAINLAWRKRLSIALWQQTCGVGWRRWMTRTATKSRQDSESASRRSAPWGQAWRPAPSNQQWASESSHYNQCK